jgi:hypothetical protein
VCTLHVSMAAVIVVNDLNDSLPLRYRNRCPSAVSPGARQLQLEVSDSYNSRFCGRL